MPDLNIVIVTYNWPPRNAIGTHRPYAWAKYWSQSGARITVLTARKEVFDEPLDLELPLLKGVDVIEVGASSSFSLISLLLKLPALGYLAKKIKSWLSQKGSVTVDPRMAWGKRAKSEAERLAKNANVVVSTYGPASSHLIACDMKKANPEIFWVADYRDLWSQAHNVSMTERVRSIARDREMSTVGMLADVVTSVSRDLVSKLEAFTGKKSILVPNGFDIDEEVLRGRFSRRAIMPEGPIRIVYTGMIYEGHRDPTPLLEALVRLKSKNFIKTGDVTIDFYGARVDYVKKLANNSGYSPFIRLMGHVNRSEALNVQLRASILLLLESPSPEARGVLTGKLFEYIIAGRPILCLGSLPEYEIGSVLRDTGTGKAFGPSDYSGLDEILLQTFSGKGMYEDYAPRLEEIFKYSRRTQSLKLLESIRALAEI